MTIFQVIQMEADLESMKHLKTVMRYRPYKLTMSSQDFLVLFILGTIIWPTE